MILKNHNRLEKIWTGRKDLGRLSPQLRSRLLRQSLKEISEQRIGNHLKYQPEWKWDKYLWFSPYLWCSPDICRWARGCSFQSSYVWRKPRCFEIFKIRALDPKFIQINRLCIWDIIYEYHSQGLEVLLCLEIKCGVS